MVFELCKPEWFGLPKLVPCGGSLVRQRCRPLTQRGSRPNRKGDGGCGEVGLIGSVGVSGVARKMTIGKQVERCSRSPENLFHQVGLSIGR